MTVLLSIYGKGGSGKSTIASNLAAASALQGKKVLQVGCDPKHDSTFTLHHRFIPTVIEILQAKDFHYEDIQAEDIIYTGYRGIDGVEAGGPPAGTGCAGYVIGETIKLLDQLELFKKYDLVIFDVLGDVVCGGFSVPLQYSQYVYIVSTDDFDGLFAANRIVAGIHEKAKMYPVRLAGIIGNRSPDGIRLGRFAQDIGSRVIAVIADLKEIKKARMMGKTVIEISESDPVLSSFAKPYHDIAAALFNPAPSPESAEIKALPERVMFERFMEKE